MRHRSLLLVFLILAVAATLSPVQGAALSTAARPEPIRYTVGFPAPESHYAEVSAAIPTDGAVAIELMIPIWSPGCYVVREHARNLEDITARGSTEGPALDVTKTRKNRWKVATGGAATVNISYRVYCRDTKPEANWVDADHAILNGGATFMTLVDRTPRVHEVVFVPPPGWRRSISGMPSPPDAAAHHFIAPDFDTLVDCPVYLGNPDVYEFKVDGKNHVLVNDGENGIWDGPRSARDVEALVRATRDMWGNLPYDRYVFFNLLGDSRGGAIEHKNSTVMRGNRWATRSRPAYLAWLNMVSHEFFHTWNVKRLRPVELGPFDYETEALTKSLWVAEGLTSYYEGLMMRRGGLCSLAEYFQYGTLPAAIEELQKAPGRLLQSAETSSYDVWIRSFRRDENAGNTGISYYTKGEVAGFLIDARIRQATGGSKSLDDAMRLAYTRYSGTSGYTPEQLRAVLSEVAGTDLSAWLTRLLTTTDELDYSGALNWYGLRFKPAGPDGADEQTGSDTNARRPRAWLGLTTPGENGRLIVSFVERGTPGMAAGFNIGDEILAVGDERVTPEVWSQRMEQYQPGEKVSILIARRGRLRRLDATWAAAPAETFKLEIDPRATEIQKAHRKAWLGE